MNHEPQDGHEHGRKDETLPEFEAQQRRELEAFEARERREEAEFRHREQEELRAFKAEHPRFEIKIDRTQYVVTKHRLTGKELRQVPQVPIGADRDLFEVKPGQSDRKILDGDVVEIHDGLRFFTAPAQINPGSEGGARHASGQ